MSAILDDLPRVLAEVITDYEGTLDLVVRTTGALLGGSSVLWLLSEDGDTVDVVSVWVADAAQREILTRALRSRVLPAKGFPVAEVISTGVPVSVGRIGSERLLHGFDPVHLEGMRNPREMAMAAVPIRARGRSFGALSVYRRAEGGAFSERDMVVLQQLADRAALSIDNARLLNKAEAAEEVAAMRAARQADIADLGHWALVGLELSPLIEDAMTMLATHLEADCVHVLDVVPGTEFLVLRASRGHEGASDGVLLISSDPAASPASLALSSGDVVVSADLSRDTRFDVPALWSDAGCTSVLELPIAGQEESSGVLGVGHKVSRPYSDDDIHFAHSVANVLAAATGRHRAEEMFREQALRDHLTRLPNRLALLEHLDHVFANAGGSTFSGALLVLDIDRFKEINDTLGHQVGDRVLLEVAERFRRLGDHIDIVARLGGDEFAVYNSTTHSAADADDMARHLLQVLGEPAEIGGVRLRLRGSVGVADGFDSSISDAVSLLRRAEAAMYRAKRHASGYSRWTPDLEQRSVNRLSLAGDLGEAIDSQEFILEYQPKVSCRTGRPLGAEALIRWRHPLRGTVLPDEFVPLAEQTGMIKPITSWVLDEALAELGRWQGRYDDLSMAVNLSASSLHDPGLFEAVAAAIERSGARPGALELEITESAVMHDPERALSAVTALTKIGVRFAIDDFGTGYSSLAYLQRLPAALVKIDKSFVVPLLEPGPARAIVHAVIELAHSLGIDVAAEGVESEEIAAVLVGLGCDELQGFHIARPMPSSALESWLDGQLARR
jgi:diguanylate cyclase (GGDEF)-like protein